MEPVFIKRGSSVTSTELDTAVEVKREPLDDFNVESFLLQGSVCGYTNGSMGDVIHQKCSNCGALFPKLSKNIRNEVNGRMINSVCSECYEEKKRAAEQQLLSLHSKNHEKPTSSKYRSYHEQTECEGCNILKNMCENLKNQTVATKVDEMDREKPFRCLACGVKILGRTILIEHMKKHFGKGEIYCKPCVEKAKTFISSHDNQIEIKWTPELNLKLIEEYKKKKCLWNVDDPDYKNKTLREESLQYIVKFMNIQGFDIHLLRNKIRSLRTVYWSEVTKIQNSPPDNPYIPKPIWFTTADSFLKLTKPNVLDTTEPFLPTNKRVKLESMDEVAAPKPLILTNNVENPPTENLEYLDSRSFANHIVSELMKISPNEILDLKMDILKVFSDRRRKRGENLSDSNGN